MDDWTSKLSGEHKKRLSGKQMPGWIGPMLAVLTEERFSSPDWIFERKLDGERCLLFRRERRVRLMSRNKNELNRTYPEIVEAIERKPTGDFIADGEIVAFEGRRTSFSRLQKRIGTRNSNKARASGVRVFLYLFDLLYVDGYDIRKLPLRLRKRQLRRTLDFDDPLRYTAHRNQDGESYYREACRKGWEGLIAKRADGPYRSSRSRDWLKFKCVYEQEFVIGGYTPPRGTRSEFGALLIGYHDGNKLRYAGKVGTGFDRDTLSSLGKKLGARERKRVPFSPKPRIKEASVHWVRPDLVAEVGFTEWTRDGRLRHPRFLGLRRDKPASKVVRERER